MNNSPDKMGFGSQFNVPMPISPQEGELILKRNSYEDAEDELGRQGSYDLGG